MKTKKKYWGLKVIGLIVLLLSVGLFFIYQNFNKLLTNALNKSFQSSILSDVYELKFEDLSVNFLEGNISIHNVEMKPLVKPLHNYSYINSSFRLTTKKLALENVNIKLLLKSGTLNLDKILIDQPEIESNINGDVPIFFPLNDTTTIVDKENKKKANLAFKLAEFKLINASIHATNTAAKRHFNLNKLTITLNNLRIDQRAGIDELSYKNVDLTIENLEGVTEKEAIKLVRIENFKLKIDSLQIKKSIDTLIYNFDDFTTELKSIDIHTVDSIFHFAMGAFQLSYKDKSIQLNNIVFKPNVSKNAIQRNYKFQHTQFEAAVGSIVIKQLNFDSLIFKHKIFIDEILIDKVKASIYKDKTRPIDTNRFPTYFGQQVMNIPLPLMIKQVKATHVNLVNTERKPDSSYAKITITRGTAMVKNITNLKPNSTLIMSADAFIEDKAHAYLTLGFDYTKPQFSMKGEVMPFNLPDLNQLLKAYTPAQILKGTLDEISFSGMNYKTNSTGTMKFLYHDLQVDLQLKNQAKWKNSALAFVANTALNSSNPVSSTEPPRIVTYSAVRDMNKGFFNIIIKSILSGFKETMFMSKENRAAHKAKKKKFKLLNKK